ncbi:MAG: pullulanase, partial [Bacteroidota bacterium]
MIANPGFSQQFTEVERWQGYALRDDATVFIYDDTLYKQKPSRVTVTGSFRTWDANMNVAAWTLKPSTATIWLLTVVNPNWERIVPNAEFKFRIDNGIWLDLPFGTPNERGTNYVFLKGVQPPGLLAEIRNEHTIWAKVRGNQVIRPADKRAYRLTDAQDNEIPLTTVQPFNIAEAWITPAIALDKRRVYFLEILPLAPGRQHSKLKSHCSFDGWFRELYSDKELGANISDDGRETAFRVFAPRAERVQLYLYAQAQDKAAYQTDEMLQDGKGVWESTIHENLHGIWYDFTVHG